MSSPPPSGGHAFSQANAREIADRTEGRPRQAIDFEDKTISQAFERMTNEELEAYARDGTLPIWFPRTSTTTPTDT